MRENCSGLLLARKKEINKCKNVTEVGLMGGNNGGG